MGEDKQKPKESGVENHEVLVKKKLESIFKLV